MDPHSPRWVISISSKFCICLLLPTGLICSQSLWCILPPDHLNFVLNGGAYGIPSIQIKNFRRSPINKWLVTVEYPSGHGNSASYLYNIHIWTCDSAALPVLRSSTNLPSFIACHAQGKRCTDTRRQLVSTTLNTIYWWSVAEKSYRTRSPTTPMIPTQRLRWPSFSCSLDTGILAWFQCLKLPTLFWLSFSVCVKHAFKRTDAGVTLKWNPPLCPTSSLGTKYQI